MSLKDLDKNLVWHPFSHYDPEGRNVVINKAEDEFLIDEEGNFYIDSVASWWVNLHGHGNPYIAQAIAKQARDLEHVIFAGFTHKPAVTLAQRLFGFASRKPGQNLFLRQRFHFNGDCPQVGHSTV